MTEPCRLRPQEFVGVVWRWRVAGGPWRPALTETRPHVPVLFQYDHEAQQFADAWAAEGHVEATTIPIRLAFLRAGLPATRPAAPPDAPPTARTAEEVRAYLRNRPSPYVGTIEIDGMSLHVVNPALVERTDADYAADEAAEDARLLDGQPPLPEPNKNTKKHAR